MDTELPPSRPEGMVAGAPPVSIGSTAAVTELDGSGLRVPLVGDYRRAISLAQIHGQMYLGPCVRSACAAHLAD